MRKCKVIIHSLDHNLITYLGQSLMPLCHNIYHTTSADEIIQLTQRVHPDLVIFGATAPLINGSSLIEKLRPTASHLPLIYVITWQLSEQVVLSLLEMGVDQYMTFPICVERLRSKLSSINNALMM